ncbi:hypothetical protein IJH27_02040 [Candidatus Saccharibacteria bacterium]|nr:hypothetical protein [Candidatus Saccharibacteria bacterium]
MLNQRTDQPRKTQLVGLLITFLLVAVAFFLFLVYKTAVIDTLKGFAYAPTGDMLAIRTDLDLTRVGTRIFNATHPVLESREDFNRDCDSTNPDIAVFGCYYADQIYVYDINVAELAGFRESTTAHELLHANWSRLTGVERNALVPLLENVYSKNLDSLKETLDTYAESEQLDELYVRIGTQIADLPETLEAHYATVFNDRQKIVEFYKSYITPFEELNSAIEKLGSELETLKTEIDAQTQEYETRATKFNASVNEFNTCANTLNCFTSDYAFRTRRNQLVAEESALDELYNSLNNNISLYNKKVDEYNSNVLRSNNLQSLINSNSETINLE